MSGVKEILNFDYRSKPQLLMLIPPLFNGAILQDSTVSLAVLPCEVYSRSSNIDIHSESTEYSTTSDENDITSSIHLKSDGGREVRKLIIGASFLIVSSI